MKSPRIFFVMGAGGVGKTTYSAALAARLAMESAASEPVHVLLITVDPARRLASAMGVVANGNDIVKVRSSDGIEFSVSMLDAPDAWDSLIRRIAPDEATASRVLSNGLYRNITGRFVNSHDYIAIERLWEVVESGEFDIIVVDTPPSRNALSVLDAAERMREFFSSRLLRWLTVPATNRLIGLTSRPFFALADRVLGARFLGDIAEFFALFRTMEPTFTAHASEVGKLMRSEGTSFVVVTTSDKSPVEEANYLADELRRRNFGLGMIVVNRTIDGAAVNEARRAKTAYLPAALERIVSDVVAEADREDAVASELAHRHGCTVVRVGESTEPVNDVATVCRLAGSLVMP
ncbi:MAG: hypothetical protein RJB08_1524 [Actinomycetota bacterium]